MQTLLRDLRYGLGSLLKQPGVSVVAVLTLALGIGANTAIFSFVEAILLRSLPFPAEEELVVVREVSPDAEHGRSTVSLPNFEDWGRMSKTIETFGAWRDWRFILRGSEGPEGVAAAIATPGLFELLRVRAKVGRAFFADEDKPGKNQVVLLSHGFWQRRFGGDPRIVGETLTLSDKPYTVVGVLPKEFDSPSLGGWEVWAPQSVDPDHALGRWLRNRRVFGRLKTGVTVEQAQAEMERIAAGLAEEYPETNKGWGVRVQGLHESEVGRARPALVVFAGAVGLVLLIACINVANLLLGRAAGRRKEMAIRAALGAGRGRILRQLLTESVLLALAGGAAGLLLALWATEVFVTLSPTWLPRLGEVGIDGGVLWFALGLSVATGIVFGLVPAVHASRVDLSEALKEKRPELFGVSGARLKNLLLISEVGLAMVLLVGAGLLAQSFVRLQKMRLGFEPANVLTFWVLLPQARYPQAGDTQRFYDRATEELRSIPGVEWVGTGSAGPGFGGREPIGIRVSGSANEGSAQLPTARYFDVTPGYFETLGVPLVKGRYLREEDAEGAPNVAVVNETMARQFWPGEDPIGKQVYPDKWPHGMEIVGVVGDVREPVVGSVAEPEIFWPRKQNPRWAAYFLIRAKGGTAGLLPAVRSRIAQIDKELILSRPTTMEAQLGQMLREPRFQTSLVGVFAGLAVLLAGVGIFGVVSYGVAQRTKEIGIRMALGAARRDILGMIVGQVLLVSGAGVVLGIAGSFASGKLLEGMLEGVKAGDALTVGGVGVLLLAVAVAASIVPARRAMRVEPVVALRHE